MIKLKKILKEVLQEGVYDPGILKVVFLAGGPGSGKTSIANQLFGVTSNSFAVSGLKPVNSDKFFEYLLMAKYQTTDLASFSPEDFDKATVGSDSEREKGKKIMKSFYTHYIAGRLGMIIDGTGHDSDKIKKQAEQLQQSFGYDVSMVFVNTSLEKAIERNNARPRKLPLNIVEDTWKEAQVAKERNKQFFGSNFHEVFNNADSAPGQPINIDSVVEKQVLAFINKPVQNPIGREWIQKTLTAKRSVSEVLESQYEIFCDMDGVLCDFVKQWENYFKGEDPNTMRHRIGKPAFDDKLNTRDIIFWSTMPWMPGASMLWNVISKYGAKVLTAPADNPESPAGKLKWISKNIPNNTPEVLFRKSTKKQEFAGENKILIDDLKRNIDQWIAKGGIGILHTSPQQTLKKLAELGMK